MLIIAADQEHNRDMFSIFGNMKVYCVFSLESPHRGDSNEYTKYTIFNIKKKNHPKLSQINSYAICFQGIPERVRKIRGKRAISVRATEGRLYVSKLPKIILVSTTCTCLAV